MVVVVDVIVVMVIGSYRSFSRRGNKNILVIKVKETVALVTEQDKTAVVASTKGNKKEKNNREGILAEVEEVEIVVLTPSVGGGSCDGGSGGGGGEADGARLVQCCY